MDQFDLAIYSGLYATFLYMQKAFPYLKETKGSVVNFASGVGLFGNYGQCSYAAAKEGIRGLMRVAANEWGKDGVNVNIVCPLAWTAQLENFEAAYPTPSRLTFTCRRRATMAMSRPRSAALWSGSVAPTSST